MSQNASRCAAAWAQQRAAAEREQRRPFTDPIEIPAAASSDERGPFREAAEEDEGQAGEAVVPPHVLLARRRAASSVCSGQGRTLKGRDLRRVRDSVLRMTGFIES